MGLPSEDSRKIPSEIEATPTKFPVPLGPIQPNASINYSQIFDLPAPMQPNKSNLNPAGQMIRDAFQGFWNLKDEHPDMYNAFKDTFLFTTTGSTDPKFPKAIGKGIMYPIDKIGVAQGATNSIWQAELASNPQYVSGMANMQNIIAGPDRLEGLASAEMFPGLALSNLIFNPSNAGVDNLNDFKIRFEKYYAQNREKGMAKVEASYKASTKAYEETDFPMEYKVLAETLGLELFVPYSKPFKAASLANKIRKFNKLTTSSIDLWLGGLDNLTPAQVENLTKLSRKELIELNSAGFIKYNPENKTIEVLTNPQSDDGKKILNQYKEKYAGPVDPNLPFDPGEIYIPGGYGRRPLPGQATYTKTNYDETLGLGTQAGRDPNELVAFNQQKQIEDYIELNRKAALTKAIESIDNLGNPFDLRRHADELDIQNANNLTSEIPTNPAIIGKSNDSWTVPEVINALSVGAKNGTRTVFKQSDENELIKFIRENGIDPYMSSDPKIGTVKISPEDNTTEFYLAAFDNPNKPGVQVGLGSKPFQRQYVMYRPNDNTFTIRSEIDDMPVAYDAKTKQNIQLLRDAEVLKYDQAILQINQKNQNAIAGSNTWKQYRAEIAELNFQKRNALFELEQREVYYYPEKMPLAIAATPSEKGAFNLMFEQMYEGKKASKMPFESIQPGITEPLKTTFTEGTLSPLTFRRGYAQNTITRPNPNNVYNNTPATEAEYEGFYRPMTDFEREMNNVMMLEINNVFKNKSIADAWQSTVNLMAARRGLPEPPIPHFTAGKTGKFNNTTGGLDNALGGKNPDSLDPKVVNKIIQRMEGMRNTSILELTRFVEDGNKLLLELGIGTKARTIEGRPTVTVTQNEIEEFMARLHDDGPIDPRLQPVYDELMKIRNLEQSEYIEFFTDYGLTELKNVFDSNPNYFPQMWIPPKGVVRNSEGAWDFVKGNPNLKQRLDIPWEDKIADGWKPITWNPFELMMLRRIRGVEHRESLIVLESLKRQNLASPVNPDPNDVNKLGWRIPKIGPSFEGVYQINKKTGQPTRVGVYYVPNYAAKLLENSHGFSNRMGKTALEFEPESVQTLLTPILGRSPEIPGVQLYPNIKWSPLDFLAKSARGFKQMILGLTPYQDIDLIQRVYGGASGRAAGKTIDFVIGTGPRELKIDTMIKDPITGKFRTRTKLDKAADILTGRERNPIISSLGLMPRIFMSRFYSGEMWGMGRRGITNRILSGVPLYDDFKISLRDVAEYGWNIEGDTSVLRSNFAQSIDDFEASLNIATRKSEKVQARLKAIRNYQADSLFKGTYRETQAYLLETVIIPELREQFPLASVDEIAAKAADNINIMTSSQGSWQTTFKNATYRDALNVVVFSPNETETWLKSFANMFKGDYKKLYGKYYMGTYLNMVIVGNLINQWKTGEPMSIDMYSPLKMKDQENSEFSKFPLAYNDKFMSPIVGFGRNGLPVKVDLVNQFDTAFQWMVDPITALKNRASPLVGFGRPWVSGTTFYGEPLESKMDKITYNAYSQLPMSIWQTLKSSEAYFPQLSDKLPKEETGLGKTQAIQISGINVKRMTVPEMMDELAKREGFEKTPTTWTNAILNFEDGLKNIFNSQLFDPDSYSPGRDMKEDYWPNQISSALTKPHNQDLADEFYERSVTGFERAEDYSQLDKLQRDRMDLEQQAVDDLLIDKNFKGPNSFWNRIQKLSQTYHTQVAALDSVMNLFEKMPSIEDYETEAEFKEALKNHRPKEPLPAARYDYYKIYDDATNDFGEVDWDQVDYQIRRHEEEVWTEEQTEHIDIQVNAKDYYAIHVPFVAELYTRKREYKDYFDMLAKEIEFYGVEKEYKEWTSYYQNNNPTDFPDLGPKYELVTELIDAVKKERNRLALNDPNLYDLLIHLGMKQAGAKQ